VPIQSWVEKKAESVKEQMAVADDRPDRKVTLRISAALYDKLQALADKTMESPTRTAEQLLEVVISDAHEAMQNHAFFRGFEVQSHGMTDPHSPEGQRLIEDLLAIGSPDTPESAAAYQSTIEEAKRQGLIADRKAA